MNLVCVEVLQLLEKSPQSWPVWLSIWYGWNKKKDWICWILWFILQGPPDNDDTKIKRQSCHFEGYQTTSKYCKCTSYPLGKNMHCSPLFMFFGLNDFKPVCFSYLLHLGSYHVMSCHAMPYLRPLVRCNFFWGGGDKTSSPHLNTQLPSILESLNFYFSTSFIFLKLLTLCQFWDKSPASWICNLLLAVFLPHQSYITFGMCNA